MLRKPASFSRPKNKPNQIPNQCPNSQISLPVGKRLNSIQCCNLVEQCCMIRFKVHNPKTALFVELFAIVDDEDAELAKLDWYARLRDGTIYLRHKIYGPDGKQVIEEKWLHREIMGNPKKMHVHHINGNTLDNRRSNLESLKPSQHRQKKRLPRELRKKHSMVILPPEKI